MYYYETRNGTLLCTIAQTENMQTQQKNDIPLPAITMVHYNGTLQHNGQCTIAK